MRPSLTFDGSGCELEFVQIRSCHRVRRSAASVSAKDGRHFV
jgi:hypothetical protein